MDELRDIKPLLEIPDYSYILFLTISFLVLFVLLIFLYILVKKFLANRKVNMQKVYLERLKEVDWRDSKKAAYEVTFLGRLLATEPRVKEIYQQLLPMIEKYKYKKEVPTVDRKSYNQYKLLVHILDESI